jgi:hypothetical protein
MWDSSGRNRVVEHLVHRVSDTLPRHLREAGSLQAVDRPTVPPERAAAGVRGSQLVEHAEVHQSGNNLLTARILPAGRGEAGTYSEQALREIAAARIFGANHPIYRGGVIVAFLTGDARVTTEGLVAQVRVYESQRDLLGELAELELEVQAEADVIENGAGSAVTRLQPGARLDWVIRRQRTRTQPGSGPDEGGELSESDAGDGSELSEADLDDVMAATFGRDSDVVLDESMASIFDAASSGPVDLAEVRRTFGLGGGTS